MMIDGYYDPPDWDPHHMTKIGNASMNYSAQILGLMFLFVCPMVIMDLMVAIAVSSAQNMQMRGKYRQTKARVDYFIAGALFELGYLKSIFGSRSITDPLKANKYKVWLLFTIIIFTCIPNLLCYLYDNILTCFS